VNLDGFILSYREWLTAMKCFRRTLVSSKRHRIGRPQIFLPPLQPLGEDNQADAGGNKLQTSTHPAHAASGEEGDTILAHGEGRVKSKCATAHPASLLPRLGLRKILPPRNRVTTSHHGGNQ
jgi:hypothetical protein